MSGAHGEAAALLGRRHELATITGVLERAAGGTFQAVLVDGEAGIGKTRLLAGGLDQARRRALQILDAFPPAGAADRAPRAGDDSGQVSRFRLVEGVLERVEAAALASPVAVGLDDLQWVDRATLLTVRAMAARLRHLPVALLLASRSGADTDVVGEVIQELLSSGATHLTLGPLTSETLSELVTAEIGVRPGRELCRLLDDAGGNPLYALELVRALDADGALAMEAGQAVPRTSAPPPSLQAAVLRRLRHYGPDAVQALRVGATLGTSFALTDLATVMDRSAVALLRDLDNPIRGGILGEHDGRLAFRHPLLRQAVYLELPQAVRAALHLEAGWRLAAAGRPASVVAPHLAIGASRGDTASIDWLLRGGNDLLTRNPAEAVRLLRRALELATPGADEHSRAAAALVDGLGWAGQLAEAVAVSRDALHQTRNTPAQAWLRASLARTFRLYGRFGASLQQVEAALAEGLTDRAIQAGLLAEAAMAHLFRGELTEAERLTTLIRRNAPTEPPFVLAVDAWIAALRGHPDRAYDLASTAATSAEGSGTAAAYRPLAMLAFAWDRADRTAEAEELLARKLLLVEERGSVHDVAWHQCTLGMLRFHLGSWDEAKLDLDSGLGLADELGVPPLSGSLWPHAVRAKIAVHEGDLHAAASLLDGPARDTDARLGLDWLRLAEAALHEARGEHGAALQALVDGWQVDARSGFRSEQPLLGPDLVRLAVAQGRTSFAGEVTDVLAEVADRTATGTARAAALRCRGLLDRDTDALLEAVTVCEHVARPLPLAQTREDAGRLCVEVGYAERAKALLLGAADGYAGLGADRHSDRVNAVLRRIGVRRGVRGSRSRAPGGPTSLTRREREIADLVAEGLTNREIGERLYVSPRTVGTHISNILTKLDLRSRVELAVTARSRRPLP